MDDLYDIDQNAQPNEQESQPICYSTILAACVYGTDGKCRIFAAKACSHPIAYKFSIKNTTKPRAQAFTTMSAFHYRVLILSLLDCLYAKPGPPSNLIAKRQEIPSIVSSLPMS